MDINKLTIGEIAKVEELSGRAIGELGNEEAPKGKLLVALAYVIKKRQDKDFTMVKAEALTMDEVSELLGLDADADPAQEK